MMRRRIPLLAIAGVLVACLLGARVLFIDPHRVGLRGTVIGAALGILNLTVGYTVMRRTLRKNLRATMTMITGGFIARLLVVVVLMVYFQRSGVASPASFALTFLVLFFIYLGVEVLMVTRSLAENRSAE
jgi:NhaP-type Na+/H+ or K+/H+ antiporter